MLGLRLLGVEFWGVLGVGVVSPDTGYLRGRPRLRLPRVDAGALGVGVVSTDTSPLRGRPGPRLGTSTCVAKLLVWGFGIAVACLVLLVAELDARRSSSSARRTSLLMRLNAGEART
jgi:hypothetical protein